MALLQGYKVQTIEIYRKIIEKYLFPQNCFAQMLEIWYVALHAWWSFTKFDQTKVPGPKMVPH